MRRALWTFLGAAVPPRLTWSLVTTRFNPRRLWVDPCGGTCDRHSLNIVQAGRWPLVTRRNIKWEGIGSAASRRPTAVSHLNFWADDEDWDDPGDGGGDFVISSLSALAGEDDVDDDILDDDIFQACDSDDDDDDEDVEAMLKVVDVGVEEDFDDDQPIDPYASLVLGHRAEDEDDEEFQWEKEEQRLNSISMDNGYSDKETPLVPPFPGKSEKGSSIVSSESSIPTSVREEDLELAAAAAWERAHGATWGSLGGEAADDGRVADAVAGTNHDEVAPKRRGHNSQTKLALNLEVGDEGGDTLTKGQRIQRLEGSGGGGGGSGNCDHGDGEGEMRSLRFSGRAKLLADVEFGSCDSVEELRRLDSSQQQPESMAATTDRESSSRAPHLNEPLLETEPTNAGKNSQQGKNPKQPSSPSLGKQEKEDPQISTTQIPGSSSSLPPPPTPSLPPPPSAIVGVANNTTRRRRARASSTAAGADESLPVGFKAAAETAAVEAAAVAAASGGTDDVMFPTPELKGRRRRARKTSDVTASVAAAGGRSALTDAVIVPGAAASSKKDTQKRKKMDAAAAETSEVAAVEVGLEALGEPRAVFSDRMLPVKGDDPTMGADGDSHVDGYMERPTGAGPGSAAAADMESLAGGDMNTEESGDLNDEEVLAVVGVKYQGQAGGGGGGEVGTEGVEENDEVVEIGGVLVRRSDFEAAPQRKILWNGGPGVLGAGAEAGVESKKSAREEENENVRKLIAAGVLRADGTELEMEEDKEGLKSIDMEFGDVREEEAVGGEEACLLLMEKLGLNSTGIKYLRKQYPPLRGEMWYRRGSGTVGTARTVKSKKVLDVFSLEETLPDLLDFLLGMEDSGGVGLSAEQVRDIFTATPNLLGLEASEALSVTEYLRSNLGLAGEGEVAAALVGCPAMLMYNVQENLAKKVRFYSRALDWSMEDVRSMLAVYPNLLSIKMEGEVVEVVDYLRKEIGLQAYMVSAMIREFPQILEVKTKRLKAVVKYLWKVLEIPKSGVAVLLSQHPRVCALEAEANVAPLRFFFERQLHVQDTARIGRLVYKFPRLLLMDVNAHLIPRADDFRKSMGLEGLEPLSPKVRNRPKHHYHPRESREEPSNYRGRGRGGGGGGGRSRGTPTNGRGEGGRGERSSPRDGRGRVGGSRGNGVFGQRRGNTGNWCNYWH